MKKIIMNTKADPKINRFIQDILFMDEDFRDSDINKLGEMLFAF